MQQHDIARAHLPEQLVRIRGEDLRVVAGVGVAQVPGGVGLAVNLVVQPLGDREEVRVAADHGPAGRAAQARAVPDEYSQHLGDPAADGGGVDVPDGPLAEPVPEPGGRGEQPRVAHGPDHRLEPGDRCGGHRDLLQAPELGRPRPGWGPGQAAGRGRQRAGCAVWCRWFGHGITSFTSRTGSLRPCEVSRAAGFPRVVRLLTSSASPRPPG